MASFDDVDIFDVGSIEPRELTPSEKRLEFVAQSLQKMGYTPRRSYQMANKITGLGETVGEILPGTSTKLAEERGDKLGGALSYLDYMAADPRIAVPTAIVKKVAKKGQKYFAKTPMKQATDKRWMTLSITDESGKKVLGQVQNIPASPGNSYIKVNTNTPEGRQFQQYLIDNQIGKQSKTVPNQFFFDTDSQKAINKLMNKEVL